MSVRPDKYWTFKVPCYQRTAKAVLTGIDGKQLWLPLSQIKIREGNVPGHFILDIPEWLRMKKGISTRTCI